MEARAQYREPRISRGLVAMVLVSVTLGLGVMAGTVAKNLSASTTATQSHVILAGSGGPAVLTVRGHGTQIVENIGAPSAAKSSFLGPDAQDRNAKLAAPSAGQVSGADARGHRYI